MVGSPILPSRTIKADINKNYRSFGPVISGQFDLAFMIDSQSFEMSCETVHEFRSKLALTDRAVLLMKLETVGDYASIAWCSYATVSLMLHVSRVTSTGA